MLTWDKNDERYYHTGIDRGVLYPMSPAVSEVVATNRATDPSLESSASAGVSVTPSLYPVTRDTTVKYSGSRSSLTNRAATSPSNILGAVWYSAHSNTDALRYRVTPGEIISISGLISNAKVGGRGQLNYRFMTSTGSVIGSTVAGPIFATTPGSWTQVKIENILVPATADYIQFYGVSLGPSGYTSVGGEQTWFDAGMLVSGPVVPEYFDGSEADTWLYRYDWTGAANASTSTKTKIAIDPVVWNGITGVDESGNGSNEVSYLDGKIFLADSDASDFSGKLNAFFFPDEFMACIGMPQVADGLILDNQKPKRFSLSYRSLIGSGLTGDQFGYQIHLIYNAMATIGATNRKSINNTPSPVDFTFDLVCTPVKLQGFRPTAHYILDTRRLDPETISELETILYGSDDGLVPGRMPTPSELYDMLHFGTSIAVTSYLANKTYNVKGKLSNVYMTGSYTYQIDNINAVDHGDGTYTISDGGDTTVTEV